jgi:phage N-6-adenine-methyltransferase
MKLAVISQEEHSETLPVLLDRAARRLDEAKSSAEVLEAKKIAEAALALAKVVKAANETHADCLRIITLAEMRMADEIDAGHERGEVRTRADNQHVRTSDKLGSLEELGVDRRRLAEWREVRDAGKEVVEQAIQGALDEGRAPTKADIKNHVRGTFGTGNNEWNTPAEYIELARSVLGTIDVDPASNALAQETIRAATYYTQDDDGLTKRWKGKVWLNPPYAQPHMTSFADKMIAEIDNGNVTEAIMLTHNYTDTTWFHALKAKAAAICFTKGRIRFVQGEDQPPGNPTQGQAFFYFGNDVPRFAEVFSQIGFIMTEYPISMLNERPLAALLLATKRWLGR